jgi:hypothetical protein
MNPIIALWSHPRSMSTALERVMRERGDLDCVHEPFMYNFYVERQVREMPLFNIDKNHPTSYEDLRDMLLERAEQQSVFFKDMSYYVMPRIIEDHDFCRRLTNCFLIRNPVASIASYYTLDPEVTNLEIGLEAQWNHFEALQQLLDTPPVIVQAEDIRADTRGVIGALWEKTGLDYRDEAFSWGDESPDDWKQVDGWHGSVSTSQSIRALTAEEIDAQNDKFDKSAQENPQLIDYLNHHMPFYNRLKEQALASS